MTVETYVPKSANFLTKRLNIYSQGIVFFTAGLDIKNASWHDEFLFLVSGITDINIPNIFQQISKQTESSSNVNFKSLYISHFYSRPFPIITISNYSEELFLKKELATVFQLLKIKDVSNENSFDYFFIFENKLNKFSVEKFPLALKDQAKNAKFIFESI
ncbi:MAG: hypothetical protein QE271_06130 [Bacteriovoracaceae bacterium]|nr:hypothetical protein [Bacteriovoracaceae bacterium]